MDLIKVEDNQNLYRDSGSGAIVNKDSAGYSRYMSEKKRREKERQELDDVKNELAEIKKLLLDLTKQNG